MGKYDAADERISGYPVEVKGTLQKIRKTVIEIAPETEETISFGTFTVKVRGQLVHFAFKDHMGPIPDRPAYPL